MRDIKFKYWNPKEQEMIIPFSNVEIDIIKGEIQVGRTYEYGTHEEFIHFIPLQFTGLKDCEGIDVYEGDIIQIEDTTDEEMFGGKVKYSITLVTYEPGFFDPIALIPSENYVIIGNKYENPELLNE